MISPRRSAWLTVGRDTVERMVSKGARSDAVQWKDITRPEVHFFGDLYNLDDLARNLGISAKLPIPRCLAAAYSRLGQGFISNLEGSYVLAVLDPEDRSVLCAADPMGQSRIYYAMAGGRLSIDFEIDPILRRLEMPVYLNEQAVYNYYHFDCGAIAPETFVSGVRTIPSGHFMRLYPQIREPDIRQYWSPAILHHGKYDEDKLVSEFRGLLTQSLARRLPEKEAPCIALSDGVGSASLAYLHRKIFPNRCARYVAVRGMGAASSVGEDTALTLERQGDETITAEFPGGSAPTLLAECIHTRWEPVEESAFRYEVICKAAAERGVTRMISGFGTEQLLCGSSALKRAWLESLPAHGRIPEWAAAFGRLDRESVGSLLVRTVRSLAFAAPRTPLRGLGYLARAALAGRGDRLLNCDGDWNGYVRAVARYLDYNEVADRFDRAVLAEVMLTRVPFCLEGFSNAARSRGMAAAFPFLSPDLARFCYSLPTSLVVDGSLDRIVLRRAMAAILPDEIRLPGPAGSSPGADEEWTRQTVGPLLDGAGYAASGIFESRRLRKEIDAFFRGKSGVSRRLWKIAVLLELEKSLKFRR